MSHQLFRTDLLTGSGNLVSFLEFLLQQFSAAPRTPLSLLTLDLNFFSELNSSQGHEHGDTALRWVGLVLAEETRARAHRIGGDEFVIVLCEGTLEEHAAMARRIYERLNRESARVALESPAASMALLHYAGDEDVTSADVLGQLGAVTREVKQNRNRSFAEFYASRLQIPPNPNWILHNMIERIVSLGTMLDDWHHLAYTDPVSGLPNLRAATHHLDISLQHAQAQEQPLSLLMIDGDNLRLYNDISYAAGDEMIQRLSLVLKNQLRPGDFLARWRVGDEFLILLPQTSHEQALVVAERLCHAVQQQSQAWPIPITISIGLASFPRHAASAHELLQCAEEAKDQAKARGKNQVVTLDTQGAALSLAP